MSEFDKLVYHIKLHEKSISETVLVLQFIIGLRPDIRYAVEMQMPDLVHKAALLAIVHEGLLECYKKSSVKSFTGKSTSAKTNGKSTFSAGEIWKAKQLKEYRRVKNLCYKCDDKYALGHKCNLSADETLHALVTKVGDGGEIISDGLPDALEMAEFRQM